MINTVFKPNSRQDAGKWIPEGMVSFLDGPNMTEWKESYEEAKFSSKEEANQFFMQACEKKYRIKN